MRTVAGIVVGVIGWLVGFYAVGIAAGLLWPAYAEAARYMFREDDLSHFTLPMLFVNWIVFLGAGLDAGSLAAWIGKNRIAPLVLTALAFVYGVVNHYWLVWNQLPDWYNVIVPFVIAVPILLGARLVKLPAAA